ncbi:MAG: xanthine dehydrogenase family protein molybdopterin-binding subunit [Proteobacteria bacterium]|nr:xanthine dehydrogenase family protein molybdopterin-binding subunit [Pseudomonadota bacterium]
MSGPGQKFPDRSGLTRRGFLLSGAAAGGGLFLGGLVTDGRKGLAGLRTARAAEAGTSIPLDARITVNTDETVTIFVPRAEMGQGVYTSLPMLAADELDVDLANVRVEAAPVGKVYVNYALFLPEVSKADGATGDRAERWLVRSFLGWQMTGGSTSVRDAWRTMRVAGAAARHMLIGAAAAEMDLPVSELTTELGFVVHRASGRRMSYGSLAAAAAEQEPPGNPRLRDASEYRYIGRPIPRLDAPSKTDGSAIFGIDVRLPGMAYAAVRHVPVFGGRLVGFDGAAIRGMPGLDRVVEVPGGIAVVADSYWRARRGADALPIEFDPGPARDLSSETILAQFRTDLDSGRREVSLQDRGQPRDVFDAAPIVVDAEYQVPYLAHATMEPMNCTALVTDGSCEVWIGTQAPDFVEDAAARITGLPRERIKVHVTFLGGGFGRRLETDVAAQALTVANQMKGRPVKLVWSREEDMQHDMYRPAALSRFRAVLDGNGLPLAVHHRFATQEMFKQYAERNLGFFARTAVGSVADQREIGAATRWPYKTPHLRVDWVKSEAVVPVGNWRSVSHSFGAFFNEVFIDELAAAARKDPVEYRRALLQAQPRRRAVLDEVARRADWRKPLPPEWGRGIALHESFGSIVAQVAEVRVGPDGAIRVERVVCAVDCGEVINPDTIEAQIQSAIVFGLSAALHGEITLRDGRVTQRNFPDYEVLRLASMPRIETVILRGGDTIGGIGEVGTPPIAPALVNAIFDATGRRLRTLPLAGQEGFGA